MYILRMAFSTPLSLLWTVYLFDLPLSLLLAALLMLLLCVIQRSLSRRTPPPPTTPTPPPSTHKKASPRLFFSSFPGLWFQPRGLYHQLYPAVCMSLGAVFLQFGKLFAFNELHSLCTFCSCRICQQEVSGEDSKGFKPLLSTDSKGF